MRRWQEEFAAVKRTAQMLVGRWVGLLFVIDGALLLLGLAGMLLVGASPTEIFPQMVLMPLLLLAPVLLAGSVAVERESGSLDLALSVPSVERYFLRRVGLVGGVFLLQSWCILLSFWVIEGFSYPILAALLHAALQCGVVCGAALFWAVRLPSRGAVWVATLLTALLLARWLAFNPIPPRLTGKGGSWWPALENWPPWLTSVGVLGAATILLTLYARRRLRRPETVVD